MGERGVLRESWRWTDPHSHLAPRKKLWRAACPDHSNSFVFPLRVIFAIGPGKIVTESLNSEKVKLGELLLASSTGLWVLAREG